MANIRRTKMTRKTEKEGRGWRYEAGRFLGMRLLVQGWSPPFTLP
jgi:hypothetical protein